MCAPQTTALADAGRDRALVVQLWPIGASLQSPYTHVSDTAGQPQPLQQSGSSCPNACNFDPLIALCQTQRGRAACRARQNLAYLPCDLHALMHLGKQKTDAQICLFWISVTGRLMTGIFFTQPGPIWHRQSMVISNRPSGFNLILAEQLWHLSILIAQAPGCWLISRIMKS